ncbi:MAG: methyl-accepting chemotaxis protein [Spirochaetes bacterium]|nr:methyl-accepting chemotaxis protein [Spirochaetota bacterium]
MFFSKLKISTKLIISSAVFFVPIGVMLFFIASYSLETIQRGRSEQAGISTLKPIPVVMKSLPEYLSIYVGLRQGDLVRIDQQISNALRTMDRELQRHAAQFAGMPSLTAEWERLKRIKPDDYEIFQSYMDFVFTLGNLMNKVAEHSRLILVSDMNTYYFVNTTFSIIPEASMRLINLRSLLWQNLYRAEQVAEQWNRDLAAAQAGGRRLAAVPFHGNPLDITVNMLSSADIQFIRNSRLFFESDIERINNSLISAMEGSRLQPEKFADLKRKLELYQDAFAVFSELSSRMAAGFIATANIPVTEFLAAVIELNFALCQLWKESFFHLEAQIQHNTAVAQRQLILYMLLVFVSLGLAIAFVVLITRDINHSVKSLHTLFKGLNENDLTMSLPIRSEDEFGELMKAFNGFLDILRSTFGSFKQSTQLVADSVFDISSSSKEITATANEQSAGVSEIVSTMESSKNLSEQISLKTTEVANLAVGTQELSNKGADLSETNLLMMEDILKQNQKTIVEMRNLSDMIVRISEAIRIIDSIADQTKLIAFNASLEASSSGEAGARFSVVASEIRRFADNVVESTREIKQKIEEVQEASQTLIAAANNGSRQIQIGYDRMSEQKKEFEQIVDNSQNVATRSQQISNLSKQQELASSQIFIALKEISAGVKQFVIATSSTSQIANSLNSMSEELKAKVEKYRTET